MTERLYYEDSYATDFEARVLAVERVGERAAVVLDRTAFYPTSGGQPFDVGTLSGVRVLDVIEREDGAILHVIDGAAPRGAVRGSLDWTRRFEHMQQHTGQHVLSAAFEREVGVRTLSFHLGSAAATIDLHREVSPPEIAAVEDAANRTVWQNRPIRVRFVSEEEAATLPLRKEPARSGRLRIVDIEDYDVSACGGTHVASTGAVGLIAVSSWERFKGASRIEFRCGVRALHAHRALRDTLSAAARLLSASSGDVPAAVERLQSEARDLTRRRRDLESRLATYQVEDLVAGARDVSRYRAVVAALADADPGTLKSVAQNIASRPSHAALLITTSPPLSVVIARAPDVTLDAAALMKSLVAEFGGKGGGRPELAQGGGFTSTVGAIQDWLERQLASAARA